MSVDYAIECYLEYMKDMSNFCLALGQVVREHREKRKWSRAYLAQKSGVSASFIRSIETRGANPTVSILVLLADGLAMEAHELLCEATQRKTYLDSNKQT